MHRSAKRTLGMCHVERDQQQYFISKQIMYFGNMQVLLITSTGFKRKPNIKQRAL